MGDARQATCPYCGAVIERAQPVVSEHEEKKRRPPAPRRRKRARPQPRRPAGSAKHAIQVLVVILGMLGLVYVIYSQRDKIFAPLYISKPVPVPAEHGQPLDVLILALNPGGESYTLVYLDGSNQTALWKSQSLSEELYHMNIVPGSSLIYLSDQTRLLAFSRNDGTLIWQASLADVPCQDCLEVFGDHLVALTEGGTLQGFDGQTGTLVWSKRLTGTPNRLLTVAGQPAVLDPTESDVMALHVLDADSGDVMQQFAPLCQHSIFEEDLALDSPVIFNRSNGTLYLLFGDLATCVQRWDVDTGEMAWSTVIDEDILFWNSATPLLANNTIYLSDGHDGTVTAVHTQDGRSNTLVVESDYDLTPLARQDDVLIVHATRTRGSERDELWGLDAESGELRWQYLLQAQCLLGETCGADSTWDWRLTSRGLVVLQVLSDPDRLIVETLNPHSGVSTGQVSTALHDDWCTDVAWTDDVAWLPIRGKLYTVDLTTGTLIYTWP